MTSSRLRLAQTFAFLVAVTVACSNVSAQVSKRELLEREDQTWHKYLLFREAVSPRSAEEYLATLDWLKWRVLSRKDIDGRYPLTYSILLWGSGAPVMKETGIVFALVADTLLRLESARCKDENEAAQIAKQYLPEISEQLKAFVALPAEKRRQLGRFALEFIESIKPHTSSDPRVGTRWQCSLLPSHTAVIARLEGTVADQVKVGRVTNVMLSHPKLLPAFASDTEFEQRRRAILEEANRRIGVE